ncbi:MAG TPA: flagellar hook-associated protein FlgK [Pseudolabrys sp.]|nr:flagellar hook-associated protein FlgK [Pseudolabrys sp.]
MGLEQTLATTLSGLRATQTGLSIVAGNVANAQTAGYVAKQATQVETATGEGGNAVQVTSINRLLDTFVQKQLWTENAGGGYADIRGTLYQQLEQVYGQPGSATSLDSVFNSFTSAVQTLSSSPNSYTAQTQALSTAQTFAQELNSASSQVQTLRSQADQGIANDVQQVNDALAQIASINKQLVSGVLNDSTKVTLDDQRDQSINQLSRLMDIRITRGSNDQITVTTSTGAQLVGNDASVLRFNASGTLTPTQLWNADPTKSGLSTITLVDPSGGTRDLVATGGIQSGEIAGYLNMRDNVLVQAQTQLDQIAAQMSSALSDTTTPATAVTVGPQTGFDADISGMSNGSTIKLSYTDAINVQHNITIVRVDDPSGLPLSNSDTSDPNDTVIGIDFSGGAAAAASALNAALGPAGLQFSNPSGTTLEMLNGSPAITLSSASTTTSATSLTGGSATLPLFTDGSTPYTGAFGGSGSQANGYAARITVNSALLADPSKLVTYQTAPPTPVGDATRPNFIYNQLVNAKLQYSPASGIGGVSAPFQGTLSDYMGQVVMTQSTASNAAASLQSGQDVVVNALQSRFDSTSAVNIDTEMANLLTLQNSYGANARVMSTVKAMLDALIQAA